MRQRDLLKTLYQQFISQSPPPSEADIRYISALRSKIDVLELELAMKKISEKPLS